MSFNPRRSWVFYEQFPTIQDWLKGSEHFLFWIDMTNISHIKLTFFWIKPNQVHFGDHRRWNRVRCHCSIHNLSYNEAPNRGCYWSLTRAPPSSHTNVVLISFQNWNTKTDNYFHKMVNNFLNYLWVSK